MKERSILHCYYRFFILFLFLLLFLISYHDAYGYRDSNKEVVALRIIINEKNNIAGELIINRQIQLKSIETPYIILPFRLTDLSTDDNTVVTSHVTEKYTILNILPTKTSSNPIKINFQISPLVVDPPQVNANQSKQPDFFLIESRGTARYTFYFRFDTQIEDKPFEELADLSQNMMIPSKITIVFPKDAVFSTIPPYDYEPYNIFDGTHPGTYESNTFTTSIDFYRKDALRINYSLPQPLPPFPSVLILIILASSLLIPTLLSLPEEILTKNLRVRFSLGIVVAIPLMLIGLGFWGGTDFLVRYLIEKYDLLIPGIMAYIFFSLVLIFQSHSITSLFRHRLVFHLTGNKQPPQPPSSSGTSQS